MTHQNGRYFLSMWRHGTENHWCQDWPCTTCATQDYRSEITKWLEFCPEVLISDLWATAPDAFIETPGWQDALRLLFGHLRYVRSGDRYKDVLLSHEPPGGSYVARLPHEPNDAFRTVAKTADVLALWHWTQTVPTSPAYAEFVDYCVFYGVRPLSRTQWYLAALLPSC